LPDFHDRGVLGLAPNFAEAYYNRGVGHNKLGNMLQANKDLAKAKELGYEP
jgi:hypothetical protein